MTDVAEQIRHPKPAKHSDNEKSKMPQRQDAHGKPPKKPQGEPPVE